MAGKTSKRIARYRLTCRIGGALFDADGPVDAVRSDFHEWLTKIVDKSASSEWEEITGESMERLSDET